MLGRWGMRSVERSHSNDFGSASNPSRAEQRSKRLERDAATTLSSRRPVVWVHLRWHPTCLGRFFGAGGAACAAASSGPLARAPDE